MTGTEIRTRRTELGLSQQELADRVGISQAMVSAYERGEFVPRRPVAFALAAALEMPRP